MSSTKPKVLNVSQRRQKGPILGHMQHAQKMVEVGRVVFELCEQTDKQTYSSQYFASLPRTT